MKVKYECGCEFDSNKKEDRAWSKYYWPDKCPRHKQSMPHNCAVTTINAPEIGAMCGFADNGSWRSSYYHLGATA